MFLTLSLAICAILTTLTAILAGRTLRFAESSAPASRRFNCFFRSNPLFILTVIATVLLTCTLISDLGQKIHVADPSDLSGAQELSQSPEWKSWRLHVHRELTAQPITPKTLAKALRIPLPASRLRVSEASTLRRDQAIADVLMSYDKVSDLLYDRFGITSDFLGTGLSKPLGGSPYVSASVHEYLVENHPDTHDHVWYWHFPAASIISSQDSVSREPTFARPISAVIAGEKDRILPANHQKEKRDFDEELKVIRMRVENKDHPLPPMIRFARLKKVNYSQKMGRAQATHVFTSNLAEVWNLTLQQAAEKSGYKYRTNDDTFFIWIFVPYHSSEFTPANWGNIFSRLPDWLERD